MAMHQWYVLQVLSGHERKVKKTIEENVAKAKMQDLVGEVLIPTEKVAEIKGGEKKIRDKSLWPGYILISLQLTDDVWHFIKDSNGVVDFLGGDNPAPLTQREVDEILSELRSKKDEVVHKYNLDVGDTVKITDGVFINFQGTVTEMYKDKGRLSVLVSIFGRDTRVDDLEFWQVEKMQSD